MRCFSLSSYASLKTSSAWRTVASRDAKSIESQTSGIGRVLDADASIFANCLLLGEVLPDYTLPAIFHPHNATKLTRTFLSLSLSLVHTHTQAHIRLHEPTSHIIRITTTNFCCLPKPMSHHKRPVIIDEDMLTDVYLLVNRIQVGKETEMTAYATSL